MTLRRPRPAFTLIELLIVMGIMVVIATLGFLFLPNLNKNKGVPNATMQLEGFVRLSKNEALKSGSPRGIRLVTDPNNPTQVTALQYIEQPEPITKQGFVTVGAQQYQLALWINTPNPNPLGQPPYPNPMPATATLVLLDPLNNFQVVSAYDWDDPTSPQIAPGDFLELTFNPSVVTRIVAGPTASAVLPGPTRSTLQLDRSVDGSDVITEPRLNGQAGILLTEGFRIIRSPRPLQGEPMLQMHKDVYIDLTLSNPFPPYLIAQGFAPNTNGYSSIASWSPNGTSLDILFNSSGQVANASTGQIMLSVVHVDRPTDILVVVIYARTGKITAVNWNDIPGSDPFLLARDGKSSGL